MKAIVTIEGHTFPPIDIPKYWVHAQLQDPTGFAFFCVDCGRVWAEIRVENRRMYAAHIPCREHHKAFYDPGGSIWISYYPHITDSFNREILEYEFHRHCEIYEQHKTGFA